MGTLRCTECVPAYNGPMCGVLSLFFGLMIFGMAFLGAIWLLWWLLVFAAMAAVCGVIWRAITGR